MKQDICNRQDIELLINSFYDDVKKDEIIGYIFNDIAKVDWQTHLPIMYDFWDNVIFYTATYNRNPIQHHIQLNHKTPLTAEHFKRWLQLFTHKVDDLFEGEKAELAKQRALSIATMMQVKILQAGV